MRAGGDIEEDHFVGALLVVAQGQLDRIAHVAQSAGFGDAELDAAGDLARMHVQAWYNTFCDHRCSLNRFNEQQSTSSEPSQWRALSACTAGVNIIRVAQVGEGVSLVP